MANTPTLPHETNAIIAHALNDAINGVIEGGPPPSVLQPRQLFMGLPQQKILEIPHTPPHYRQLHSLWNKISYKYQY